MRHAPGEGGGGGCLRDGHRAAARGGLRPRRGRDRPQGGRWRRAGARRRFRRRALGLLDAHVAATLRRRHEARSERERGARRNDPARLPPLPLGFRAPSGAVAKSARRNAASKEPRSVTSWAGPVTTPGSPAARRSGRGTSTASSSVSSRPKRPGIPCTRTPLHGLGDRGEENGHQRVIARAAWAGSTGSPPAWRRGSACLRRALPDHRHLTGLLLDGARKAGSASWTSRSAQGGDGSRPGAERRLPEQGNASADRRLHGSEVAREDAVRTASLFGKYW